MSQINMRNQINLMSIVSSDQWLQTQLEIKTDLVLQGEGERWKVSIIRIRTQNPWLEAPLFWPLSSDHSLGNNIQMALNTPVTHLAGRGLTYLYTAQVYVFKWHNWQLSSVCHQGSVRVQPENALLQKRWVVSLISNTLEHFKLKTRLLLWGEGKEMINRIWVQGPWLELTTEWWALANHQPSYYPLHIQHMLLVLNSPVTHLAATPYVLSNSVRGQPEDPLGRSVNKVETRQQWAVCCIGLFQVMMSRRVEIVDLHTETQMLSCKNHSE